MEFKYSKLGINSAVPSAVNRMTAAFAGNFREGIDINLGVGYVNDQTIPSGIIGKAFQEVIKDRDKYRNALNYGAGEGSSNLIRSIKNYYLRHQIGGLDPNDWHNLRILIGANGATSLLDSLSDIFKPGIVITSAPYYYIFIETLQHKGYEIHTVPEDRDGIVMNKLHKKLKEIDIEKLRFFYTATVNNPSTVILSNNRRKKIVELFEDLSVKKGYKIPVILDKAYEDIIHNPFVEQPVSGLKYDRSGIVFEVGTLSKVIAPALRIGYLICRDDPVCEIIIQRTSDIGFSAPLINQEMASWLLDNYIEIQRDSVNRGYASRAKSVKKMLSDRLGDYIEDIKGGDAAFYFFLTFKKVRTNSDSHFYRFLSRTTGNKQIDGSPEKNPRLVYIPGVFCNSVAESDRQLRLSYGFENVNIFEKAINLIKQACEYTISIDDLLKSNLKT